MKIMKIAAQNIKNLLQNTINNQKGVVLPIILMAIGGLSLLGAAAISVSSGEMNIAHNDRNYKTAFNLAEAGINDAVDGIGGNRDLLPRPLGAITTASYSFSVGGAGLNGTGRYNVNVTIPVVAMVTQPIALNASTVVVDSTAGLNVGNTIVIGNASSRYMTTIGAIDTSTNTLTLRDSQGRAYAFKETFSANNAWVALNLLRVTATGEAGTGLAGNGNSPSTIGGWRNVTNINATPNPSVPAGTVRSTVTLQGEYSLQEIAVFDSLQAGVNSNTPPNTFKGPILVTNQLQVQPYSPGNYTGPIFNATNNATNSNIQFQDAANNNMTTGIPRIISVPGAAGKVNVTTILNNAASNAACYQQQCSNASATQQIYYLNGYQIDVRPYKTPQNGTLYINIDDESPAPSTPGYITFSFQLTTSFNLGSNENVTVVMQNPGPPTNTSNRLTPNNIVSVTGATPGDGAIGTSGQNITFAGGHYTNGTIITVQVSTSGMPAAGTYVWLWDNSQNIPGFGAGTSYSDGVWMTPLGAVESQEYQGDVSGPQADATSGTHMMVMTGGANSSASHASILKTQPTRYARGIYTTGNNNVSGPTATATSLGTGGDGGAVLFGGRLINSGTWPIGDQATYYTTYFIHTDTANCLDHDIKVVSKTRVTYLGTGLRCSGGDTARYFLYETIWNHVVGSNNMNAGYQVDPTLLPQKGYYKFVSTKKTTDTDRPVKVVLAIGDKEFNSVFNHAAKTAFTSSILNVNIGSGDDKGSINLVGFSNPPTQYNANAMNIATKSFSTWTGLPTNPFYWDAIDMPGAFSGFGTSAVNNGFDFYSGFYMHQTNNVADGNVVPYNINGNEVLPDVYLIPTTGSINTYRNITPGTYPGTWNSYNAYPTPNGTNGAPILDPNNLPTSVITATISGPYFSWFTLQRGTAPLFFNAANGIPFNVQGIKVETKSGGANITIGSSTNPATVYATKIELEPEGCAGTTNSVNFNFTGKLVASEVEFENNTHYTIDTTLGGGASCLSPQTANFIYLRKQGWKEIRN